MTNQSRIGRSVLIESQVAVIKHKLYSGTSPRHLAEAYGVAVETIRRIGRGETWGWVEPRESEATPLPAIDEQQSLATLQRLLGDIQATRSTSDELKKLKEP